MASTSTECALASITNHRRKTITLRILASDDCVTEIQYCMKRDWLEHRVFGWYRYNPMFYADPYEHAAQELERVARSFEGSEYQANGYTLERV